MDYDVAASWAREPSSWFRAPAPDQMAPKMYQHAGVEYILSRSNGLIGDEMGLGKTAQCIMVSNAIEARRTLVVCPASLRLNWEREIWKWSMQENVSTYPIFKASNGVSTQAHYCIVSYDLLRNPGILAAMLSIKWDHMVLDEAHFIKDPGGNKRTKVICAPDMLPSVVGRITLASGTILPNNPAECYNAVRLCAWDAIDRASLQDFREKYYDLGEGMIRSPVYDPVKKAMVSKVHFSDKVRNVPRNLEDLQYRLRKHVMVRRLKADVLPELPARRWQLVPLEVTSGIRAALKHPGWAIAEKLYAMDNMDTSAPIDGEVATARRLLGEAKAEPVAEYVSEMLRSGMKKVVVSAWHRSVLAVLKGKLSKYGLVYMDGGTSDRAKQEAEIAFQSDDSVRVILGQTKVIGLGWTLTAAQDVVLAEPDWSPGPNEQCLDRVHRIGQVDAVTGHMPVVPGTMDERVLGTAIRKDKNIFAALDKQNSDLI